MTHRRDIRASVARRVAVIAGSGMGALAGAFDTEETVPFDEIDGVGACTVPGHAGEVRWHRHGPHRTAFVLGRRHFYEGAAGAMEALIGWLAARGTTHIVSVSAAGALTMSLCPGDLVLVRSLVDLQNRPVSRSPAGVRGIADDAGLDVEFAREVERAAKRAGVPLHRGTIACGAGPAYETRAEVGWLQFLGADLATMSAAPEVEFARRAGLRMVVLAVITNPATGILNAKPGHDEVVAQAGRVAGRVGRIISQLTSM